MSSSTYTIHIRRNVLTAMQLRPFLEQFTAHSSAHLHHNHYHYTVIWWNTTPFSCLICRCVSSYCPQNTHTALRIRGECRTHIYVACFERANKAGFTSKHDYGAAKEPPLSVREYTHTHTHVHDPHTPGTVVQKVDIPLSARLRIVLLFSARTSSHKVRTGATVISAQCAPRELDLPWPRFYCVRTPRMQPSELT